MDTQVALVVALALFLAGGILAAVQKSYAVALIAAGLAVTILPRVI